MAGCKGLKFPVLAIPGVDRAWDERRKDEAARLLSVVMTRATWELAVTG